MEKVGTMTGVSRALQISLWISVVLIAFVMQVFPFLLVLTMFNLAVGISSGVALVVIPIGVFGMLFVACWFATRRAKAVLPPPRLSHQQACLAPYMQDNRSKGAQIRQNLVPVLQRFRNRGF